MNYKRFFAFGCSFTKFGWPTWADIIAKDLKIKYYNLGLPGFGNVGIHYEFLSADLEYNFNDSDLIIIIWSHWFREDRFLNNSWVLEGNIFSSNFYNKKFIKKYWSYQNDIIKNSSAIILTNKAYKDLIKFQGHIIGLAKHEDKTLKIKNNNSLLQKYISHIPSENVFDNYDQYHYDDHPSVLGHLEYVKNIIYPKLNLKLNSQTENHFMSMHYDLKKLRSSESVIKYFSKTHK